MIWLIEKVFLYFKDQQMLITINIEINEKGEIIKTIPELKPPIKYNNISIKRKYYNKWDPKYHRNKIGYSITRQQLNITKTTSKILKSDRIVKQEPLLDLDY